VHHAWTNPQNLAAEGLKSIFVQNHLTSHMIQNQILHLSP